MDWYSYIFIGFILAGLFFASVLYALYWASKNGQFRELEKGAYSIFDEEEPLSAQTDCFPENKSKFNREGQAIAK